MSDLCYVENFDGVICHHYNNRPEEVLLQQHADGEKFGVCSICETKYVAKEVNK